jgi:6-methylsalicylic acid synthase
LEAAAGVIGVLKAVLSLQKGVMAPQALLNNLNTKKDWANSGLKVVRKPIAWPDRDVRRATVCSYGYDGSVCHTILEQASKGMRDAAELQRSSSLVGEDPVIITLSAVKEDRLPMHAAAIARWLSDSGTKDLTAVARTLSQRRATFNHRVSLIVTHVEDAISALTDYEKGRLDKRTTSARVLENALQKGAVWVFSGHGAQSTIYFCLLH